MERCGTMESLEGYLDSLASAAPAPGGGSAAAVAGALAASLIAMVARITASNPKFASAAVDAAAIAGQADELRSDFSRTRCADEAAFAAVVAAQGLPRSGEAEKAKRTAALQAALAAAAAAPLACAELAVRTLHLAARAGALGNANLQSDVACAGEFAHAAVYAAAYNVRANHPWLHDARLVSDNESRLQRLLGESDAALEPLRRLGRAA